MPGAGDLEEDLLLVLEHDLAVIGSPRKIHEAVDLDQAFGSQSPGRFRSSFLKQAGSLTRRRFCFIAF